jgi:hypothetical protein
MIQFILILLVCSCIGLDASPDDLDDYRPKIHNEKRYEDLLVDPFNKRLLSIILDPRSYDGPNSGFTMINHNEIVWCREQGVKAFPMLLEVLKREPTPNAGDHGKIWRSVDFKEHVLCFIKIFPGGDTKPFVEEVRRQLPQWSERQIPNHDAHTAFIREALDLLAREGDESDIPLMELFLNDANRNNRHYAQISLTKIKKRFASLSNEESGIPGESSQGQSHQNSSSRSKKESQNLIANEKTFDLFWLGSGLLIIGVVALVLRVYKRGSKT